MAGPSIPGRIPTLLLIVLAVLSTLEKVNCRRHRKYLAPTVENDYNDNVGLAHDRGKLSDGLDENEDCSDPSSSSDKCRPDEMPSDSGEMDSNDENAKPTWNDGGEEYGDDTMRSPSPSDYYDPTNRDQSSGGREPTKRISGLPDRTRADITRKPSPTANKRPTVVPNTMKPKALIPLRPISRPVKDDYRDEPRPALGIPPGPDAVGVNSTIGPVKCRPNTPCDTTIKPPDNFPNVTMKPTTTPAPVPPPTQPSTQPPSDKPTIPQKPSATPDRNKTACEPYAQAPKDQCINYGLGESDLEHAKMIKKG